MDVQWDVQGGPCSKKKYKIKVVHLGYIACPSRSLKNPVPSKTASTSATKASFEKLEAYSTYNVSIEGIDSDDQKIRGHLKVETLSDKPDLKPSGGTADPLVQAIHFGWANQPIIHDETTCKLQVIFNQIDTLVFKIACNVHIISQNFKNPYNLIYTFCTFYYYKVQSLAKKV